MRPWTAEEAHALLAIALGTEFDQLRDPRLRFQAAADALRNRDDVAADTQREMAQATESEIAEAEEMADAVAAKATQFAMGVGIDCRTLTVMAKRLEGASKEQLLMCLDSLQQEAKKIEHDLDEIRFPPRRKK